MAAKDWFYKLAAGATIAALCALVWPPLVRRRRLNRVAGFAADLLGRFDRLDGLGLYLPARPRYFPGGDGADHAVLLIHGFSSSPGQYEAIYPALEQAGIPYYAPLLTGFGRTDLHGLKTIRPDDWRLDAATAYELLAERYDRVSVVGHSMGALLSVWLSARRPVEQLILSDPYFVAPPEDRKWARLYRAPYVGYLLRWWAPIYGKEPTPDRPWGTDIADPEAAEKAFHFPALTAESAIALWDLKDEVDIAEARCQGLTVLYGVHDKSADVPALLKQMDDKGLGHRTVVYDRSGHNALQDYDRHEVAAEVVRILKG